MKIIREACIENATFLKDYIKAGADRIELCDNIYAGGTTPSLGTIGYSKNVCKEWCVELAVMIRARGGDFVYSGFEKEIMLEDMKNLVKAATFDRFVIGALTDKGEVDREFIKKFVYIARFFNPDIKITFHMAFDHIGDKDSGVNKRLEAMKELKELGINTILTHGSSEKNDIFENIDVLRKYVDAGKECGIVIMPGGGVNCGNMERLIEEIPGIRAVHGTGIVKIK